MIYINNFSDSILIHAKHAVPILSRRKIIVEAWNWLKNFVCVYMINKMPFNEPFFCQFSGFTHKEISPSSLQNERKRKHLGCICERNLEFSYLLEKIRSVFIAKEWYSVRQHPDIATSAIVIWLWPSTILVLDWKNFIRNSIRAVWVKMVS